MTVRVQVAPALLDWARERARIPADDLLKRFPKLPEWRTGDTQPTLKQLENYASATHTPVGFLLLATPPDEPLPIPDFRTMADQGVRRPSADLLDTIYICQERQDWYRDYARATRQEVLSFVGSLTTSTPVTDAAEAMRDALVFGLEQRRSYSTWTAALSGLAEHAEDAGVLVMVNGIVGSNTHRKLDPKEFRGFALPDPLAPVIFINGADTKAAQIFTVVHELAHIWVGEAALDDADLAASAADGLERWCNQVAAEFLVPAETITSEFDSDADLTGELDRLARIFKTSTLTVLRRVHEIGQLSWNDYRSAYSNELARVLAALAEGGLSGGNFYNTTPVRASKRFARALLASTMEGNTLYRDAARLLGFKKLSTLDELGHRLGVA